MSKKRKPKTISQDAWDAVDSPELTDDDFARMRPAEEVVPEVVKAHRRTRGPQKASKKVSTTIRLDADILEHFKSRGRGWQTHINDELRKIIPR